MTLTADIVDMCLPVGERLDADALVHHVEGDDHLARELVAAAPTSAVL